MAREKAGVDLHREWVQAEVHLPTPDEYTRYEPQRVYIPMQQHVGAPCKPVVQVGDTVRLGQQVGVSDEFIAAPVHASVSGTVVDIAEIPQVRGKPATCVVIESDGKNTPCPRLAKPGGEKGPSVDSIREAVRAAGVVGMGGAAFPTHVKLDPKDAKVDTLIVNGAECEPGLYADNALMVNHAAGILAGAELAMAAVGASRILVGIEDSKPGAIAAMREAAQGIAADINVIALPRLYPQGGEKQLIHRLTKRQVPEGELPAKAGVAVINVATAFAIANAVEHGAPLTHRICTVTGDVTRPQNVCAPIGTPLRELIAFCGGFRGRPSKLIAGGPMMGATFEDWAAPLIKATNGLVAVGEAHDAFTTESPCIRCNRCVEVCPMYLVPWKLDRYWRNENTKGCRSFHAQSCINCGCCTYICPAKRPLAEKITEAKNELARLDKEANHG